MKYPIGMTLNHTRLAFANRIRCRHADAIHSLGFISWRMGRARLSIGYIVYLFMSDERCVRFKMVVTAENCEREDKAFWVETPPNDRTYKLELLEEYEGTKLSEKERCMHGWKGGGALEVPNCNNTELIGSIKSIF